MPATPDTMPLPVTALFAGLLALRTMVAQGRMIAFRGRRRVAPGDGGIPEGARLISAHGNAVETIPILLILLALAALAA